MGFGFFSILFLTEVGVAGFCPLKEKRGLKSVGINPLKKKTKTTTRHQIIIIKIKSEPTPTKPAIDKGRENAQHLIAPQTPPRGNFRPAGRIETIPG